MPPAFAYIIDELIHVDYSDENKKVYYDEIIRSIIDSEMGAEFIERCATRSRTRPSTISISSAISLTGDPEQISLWKS